MKTLKKFEFKSGSESSYDWAKFFNGQINVLTEGEDYNCKTPTFAQMARNQARKAYKTIQISVDEEAKTVTLQTTDMTAEQREKEDVRRAEKAARVEAKKIEETAAA